MNYAVCGENGSWTPSSIPVCHTETMNKKILKSKNLAILTPRKTTSNTAPATTISIPAAAITTSNPTTTSVTTSPTSIISQANTNQTILATPNCFYRPGLVFYPKWKKVKGNHSAKECQQKCAASLECEAWELEHHNSCNLFKFKFVEHIGGVSGAMPKTAACGEALNQPKSLCFNRHGLSVYHETLGTRDVTSAENCRKQCAERTLCMAWAWDSHSLCTEQRLGLQKSVESSAGFKFC